MYISYVTFFVSFLCLPLFQAVEKADKIYIYTPPIDIDYYPKQEVHTGDFKSIFRQNNGTGEVLDEAYGMHETFQFSLFDMIYNRLLVDPRRTLDPSEATAFFIPYDIAIDSLLHPDKGIVRRSGCPHALPFIDWLSENPYFNRNYGHDHFVVYGGNQALFFFNRVANCSKFLTYFCENCTKLALDTYPNGYNSPHWVSVPFPSNFHWSSRVRKLPWGDPDSYRGVPISYTGGVSTFSKHATNLRRRMVAECEKHPDECVHNSMGHSSAQAPRNWSLALNSTFCLNPSGDLATRKGFFDSILAGCIPVVSSSASAHDVWKWHLGDMVHNVTVFIPTHVILRENHDFIATLLEIYQDKELVRQKRQAIASIANRLQYRLPEKHHRVSPPIDAVDVILENIFRISRNVSYYVKHPVDRGDNSDVEVFPYYPLGRNAIDYHDPNFKYNMSFIITKKIPRPRHEDGI